VSSWRWSFDEDLRFWVDAGIDHVGLSFRKLVEVGTEDAVRRVRDAGLRVSNLVELGCWDLAAPSTWAAQQDRLLEATAVADTLGGCLVLTTGPALGLDWDAAAEALDEALDPVRSAAERAGVLLAIEHTGPLRVDLSFVTTLRDGVDLARRLGAEVCVEVNSCFAERDLIGTLAGAHDLLGHVQLSDFVVGSLCTPDRAVPGDGDIDLSRVLAAILAAGYTGAFEIEMVGPRIEAEGYESAITRAVSYLDDVLARLA
jgi:sugar phosphate isomerase/epimerase